jgi:hypothetical protein
VYRLSAIRRAEILLLLKNENYNFGKSKCHHAYHKSWNATVTHCQYLGMSLILERSIFFLLAVPIVVLFLAIVYEQCSKVFIIPVYLFSLSVTKNMRYHSSLQSLYFFVHTEIFKYQKRQYSIETQELYMDNPIETG